MKKFLFLAVASCRIRYPNACRRLAYKESTSASLESKLSQNTEVEL